MKQKYLLKSLFLLTLMLAGSFNGAWAQDIVWDFTDLTAQSFTSNTSYSFNSTDGTTEMRYSAGSSDAIIAKNGTTNGYLKENGTTGSGTVKDIDGTTNVGKTRLIRLFVTGKGKLTITCNSTAGKYKVLDGATNGTTLVSSLSAGTQSDEIEVTNFLWIETSTKGYIEKITWSPSSTAKFTVTFDAGSNGECTTSSLTEASAGAGVTLPDVTPNSGYEFNGWYPEATGGTKVGDAGVTYHPTSNTILYAQYTALVAPDITTEPADVTVGQGEAATFTVVATGTPEPTYQWYSNTTNSNEGGTAIVGETSASYSPSTAVKGITYYYVVVTNSQGNVTSRAAMLKVKTADQTVFSASVAATSDQSFNTGTTELTSSQATITGGKMYAVSEQSEAKKLIAKQGSTYYFAMTNNNTYFKLELNEALAVGDVITIDGIGGTKNNDPIGLWVSSSSSYPSSAPACTGVSTTTSLVSNLVNYTVATGDEYVGKTEIYIYRAVGASTYFNNVKVTRPAPTAPVINTQPVGASYVTGQTVEPLTVVATASDGTLSYQWYSCDDANKTNASAIDGATSASYTPSETGFYYVKVTDSNGSVDSDVVEVTISAAEAPSISVSGAPAGDVLVGTEITLTATVTGVPTPTITWYNNSNDEQVGTGETFTVPTNAAGTFVYYASADNGVGEPARSENQTIVVKEQVATPTFDPNGAYFQESQEVTLDCTTAGATIQYSTDGGTTWNDYTEALTFTATTTVQAKAIKDGYIDSEVATATFTKVTLVAQTDVTGAATWDWNDFTSGEVLLTAPLLNEDVVMANIPAYGYTMTPKETFDAQALLVNCQYAWRNANSSKFLQGSKIQFNTTVPGSVTVEYANTGGNAARTVVVNEQKGTLSSEANNSYQSETFTVAAGTVTIKGVQVSDNADKMLRIRKVVFTPVTAVTITPAKQYVSFSSPYALDFTSVSGLEAYVVTADNITSVSLQKVNKVKAGEGLILKGTANTEYTVPTMSGEADTYDNLLKGTGTEGVEVAANSVYVLSDGQLKRYTGTSIAAGKAYLPASGEAPSLSLDFGGDATGIRSIENGQLIMDNVIYDLNGRRVENPSKGVYIMNGRKIVIK